MDICGKVVVITGASRGLGAGMARTMTDHGVRLGLCARTRCAIGADVLSAEIDVRDAAGVSGFAADVVKRFGHIDLWINNAGVLDPVRFVRELDTEALTEHLAITVAGVLHGSRAFIEHLRTSGRQGVLINISSGAAQKGYAGWGAYCAGKAAVDRLTECIQLEEADHLRAYAVAPGVIDTDMQRAIRGMSAAQFPAVDKFLALERDAAFNKPAFVAEHLLRIAFDESTRPDQVVLRLPRQP